jgi:hypothetical protein
MTKKYTKWPSNIPNGGKIYPMAKNIPAFSIPRLFKFPQIGISVLKYVCHLATLLRSLLQLN